MLEGCQGLGLFPVFFHIACWMLSLLRLFLQKVIKSLTVVFFTPLPMKPDFLHSINSNTGLKGKQKKNVIINIIVLSSELFPQFRCHNSSFIPSFFFFWKNRSATWAYICNLNQRFSMNEAVGFSMWKSTSRKQNKNPVNVWSRKAKQHIADVEVTEIYSSTDLKTCDMKASWELGFLSPSCLASSIMALEVKDNPSLTVHKNGHYRLRKLTLTKEC